MSKAVRAIVIAVGCAAGVAVILLGAWLVLSRMSFPRTRGTVSLEGLSAPVTVERDRYGVPHIYAHTSRDLFFAEGYVHAQDRFWQMEFCRRIGRGRLSELFGKSQLQTDIFLRTLGIARVARAEYEQTDPETKAMLDAYAKGVNAYILSRDPARLGLEFAVLNLTGVKTKIEPWTPVDTIAWAKMMALSEESSWDQEFFMTRLLHVIGTRGLPDFITPYQKVMPFTVSNAELKVAGADPSRRIALLGSDRSTGSNGWVISGSLSATGKPILANDMHLDLQIPAIWYEAGLHGLDSDGRSGRTAECPYDLYGYSLPGVPGVVAGHNDRIAWGAMDLSGDVQDLYLERINPDNPDQYLADGQWKNMDIVYEEIPVRKEKEPYRLRVRSTRHGPIISDHGEPNALEGFFAEAGASFPNGLELTSVSLRWSALEPSNLVGAELHLDRARNYDEFREALRGWTSPALNIVYADVDGNIAYQCVGRIPIRQTGSGEAPMPGWSSDYEWKGFIPFDDLPRSLNPAKGYIVNANNPPAGPAYPYLLGKELNYGFRARRIVEMIETRKGPIGIKDVEAMQADDFNYTAREVCAAFAGLDLHPTALERHLTELQKKDMTERQKRELDRKEAEAIPRMQKARDLLLAWDGHMSADSSASALYAYVWRRLVDEVFRDQYPEAEWPMGAFTRAENAVHYLLKEPDNRLWDDVTTPARERRDEILVRSFRRGYAELVDKLGTDPKRWRWDKVHTITFVNQTLGKSGVWPIERIFNRGPYPVGSGATQVNVQGWDRKEPFDVLHIPSMRQIVDLGDLAASLTVLPTGESGHPGNRHYADQVEAWRTVRYHPMLWDRREVERQSEGRLLLLPKAPPRT